MTTVRSEDREGGVRLLTLDRPPANAITIALLADLSAALDAAREDDGVRAVVLTGEGKFFSGGLDLRGGIDFQAAIPAAGRADPFSGFNACMLNFLRFPKPTVAMLRGHAVAGGFILLLTCDFRVGLDGDYRVGLNEVELGASFPKAAFEVARLRLTHSQASELLLGAATYPASEGVRLGAVNELLPAEGFEEAVMSRAARLGSFPRDAYAHTKLALTAEARARIEAETPEEAIRNAAIWMTPESVEARAAQARKLGGSR